MRSTRRPLTRQSTVFLWFDVGSVAVVTLVFDSPSMDAQLVALGAVLLVTEALIGGPWLFHTPILGVLGLAIVMLVARDRRLVQRRCLGVPIGVLSHQVLDGTWADTRVFWWPATGFDVLGGSRVPEFGRGTGGLLPEASGLLLGAWVWRRHRLADPDRRLPLLRAGRLDTAETS
ncbi:MAG: hypothetical protein CL468_05850 [Acidimicrobiaceae bacterium]|nr:hypothetical protein [Acidimicrobiaceae bacterium]